MPNHVKTIIKFSNIKKNILLNDLFTKQDGEDFFDFNKLIPMPETLGIPASSSTAFYIGFYLKSLSEQERNEEIDFLKNQISNWFLKSSFYTDYYRGIESVFNDQVSPKILDCCFKGLENDDYKVLAPQCIEDIGKGYIENIKKYGCDTWYSWCVYNWGTKWNSYANQWEDKDKFSFQTAWNIPLPIIIALSKKYPEATFQCCYANEDYGSSCGSFYIKNENVDTLFSDFDPHNKTSEVILKFAIEDVWGHSYNEYLQEQAIVTEDEDNY